MFTKEHYEKIAEILKENEKANPYLCTREFQSKTVQSFVVLFKNDGKKFDKERFLDAIYGKEKKHEKR